MPNNNFGIVETPNGSFQTIEVVPNAAGYYAVLVDSEGDLYATKFPHYSLIKHWVGNPDTSVEICVPIPAGEFKDPTALIAKYRYMCDFDALPPGIPIKDDADFNYFLTPVEVNTLKATFDNLPG